MKKWKRYLPVVGVFFTLVLAAIVMSPVSAKTDEASTIPQRVYFGDISVGGMTQEEAASAVEEYLNGLQNQTVTLRAGANSVDVPLSKMGLSWGNPEIAEEAVALGKSGNLIVRYKAMKDLENEDKVYELDFKADGQKISQMLEEQSATLNTEAKDGSLTRENETFTVVPGSQGVSVNIEESAKILEDYFSKEWKGEAASIEMAADVVEPKGSEAELSKVKDLLGGFHTSFGTSSAGRAKNVRNGAEKINGSVIYPGDTFSVYEAVSPFDAENGYELAGSYENGTTVETYGGGICQVSTTLYNAVIRAELEITERFNHSMIVGYVDPSADAAIAGTYKDLKFINNTDAPIYIEGYTQDMVIYFNVFGQETRLANREVIFESETLSTTDPGVQYQASGDPIGHISQKQSSHVGYTAQLWKIVKVDGVEQSREVFNKSTYKASPRIVVVGTGSANPEASAAMNAAVATQDQATIDAAAAQWNDAALAQQAAQQAAAEQAAQQQQQQQQEPQPQPGDEEPKDDKPKEDEPKEDEGNDKKDGKKDGDESGDE